MSPTFITDENGNVLTTENGVAITVDESTDAQDIQNIDFSVDLMRAILWQYDSAPAFKALIEAKQKWYNDNQTDFWENWLRNVFDLRTANEFGLAVWSIILGLPLFVNRPADPYSKKTFGFDSPFYKNFDNGNFSNFGSGTTYTLPIEVKRLALRLRYYQLTSSGTVPEINRMLKELFAPFGRAYLLDRGDMTQTYVFGFTLPSSVKFLFDNLDILPRPAGVGSRYIETTKNHFGFGPFGLNFDNGNFGA